MRVQATIQEQWEAYWRREHAMAASSIGYLPRRFNPVLYASGSGPDGIFHMA